MLAAGDALEEAAEPRRAARPVVGIARHAHLFRGRPQVTLQRRLHHQGLVRVDRTKIPLFELSLGPALGHAVLERAQRVLAGRPVVLPEFPQLAGAIGAALYAIDETERIGSGTNLTAGETDG